MSVIKIPSQAWVVVCDGAKALMLRNEGDAQLVNLKPMDVHVQSVPPTRELGTDRAGRVHPSHGGPISGVEATDLHSAAETEFLNLVARQIDKAVEKHAIKQLILVAPPRALGVLRQHLTPAAQDVLLAEVPKDLAHLTVGDIEKHLRA